MAESSPPPLVGGDTPMGANPLLRRVAAALLRLFGWRALGELPATPKYVLVGAPHTSNWDWALMVLAGAYFGLRPWWTGKRELFRPPLGWLLRRMHGIPIDRSGRHGVVDQAVAAFRAHERMVILVTPEGTRGWAPKWRTGFYHIAVGAGVPIVLAYVDYPRRVAGIGPTIEPSGDMEADLQRIAAFYADKRGRFPANQGPVLPAPPAGAS